MLKKKIVLSAEAHAKIENWVDLCKWEISGLGTLIEEEDRLYVDQVFLLDQEVTSAETEISDLGVSKLVSVLPKPMRNTLRFWWHSHVNMDVFWSGTDESCIRKLRGEGALLSIVFNKKGQTRTRIDYDNGLLHSKMDGLSYEVEEPDEDITLSLGKEILDEFPGDPYSNPLEFARFYQECLNTFDGHNVLRESLKDFCSSELKKKVKYRTYYQPKTGSYRVVKGKTPPRGYSNHTSYVPLGVEDAELDAKFKYEGYWDDDDFTI